MKLHIALLASAMAFGLAACDSSKDTDTQTSAPAASESAAPQTPAPAPTPEPTDATPAAPAPVEADEQEAAPAAETTDAAAAPEADVAIGVKECDEFLTAVKSCINSTVPADQRAAQMKQIDEMASMWESLPKDSLAPMCKQAHDAAKTTYASYGCSF